jgi:hypothetical protein
MFRRAPPGAATSDARAAICCTAVLCFLRERILVRPPLCIHATSAPGLGSPRPVVIFTARAPPHTALCTDAEPRTTVAKSWADVAPWWLQLPAAACTRARTGDLVQNAPAQFDRSSRQHLHGRGQTTAHRRQSRRCATVAALRSNPNRESINDVATRSAQHVAALTVWSVSLPAGMVHTSAQSATLCAR